MIIFIIIYIATQQLTVDITSLSVKILVTFAFQARSNASSSPVTMINPASHRKRNDVAKLLAPITTDRRFFCERSDTMRCTCWPACPWISTIKLISRRVGRVYSSTRVLSITAVKLNKFYEHFSARHGGWYLWKENMIVFAHERMLYYFKKPEKLCNNKKLNDVCINNIPLCSFCWRVLKNCYF